MLNEPITLTMLSCKRYSFFEKTFNSFFDNCQDLDLIKNIIIVDDNSSIEDRVKMQQLLLQIPLPNLIICKNQFKGQAISLNILGMLTPTKYTFHIEDDFAFIQNGSFIRDGLEIIQKHPFVKRVCVDAPSSGKNIDKLDEDILDLSSKEQYFIHTNKNLGKEWPSFTFRQSLIDNTVFQEVGFFSGSPRFSHEPNAVPTTETDYAVRYCEKGYKTAFLMKKYCQEISPNSISSFYLNNVNRHCEV
jgi:hypothetical protein